MAETHTMLVVSTDHVQDIWRGRPDAIENMVRAVEWFQPVLTVMDGPDAVEPLTPERTDIVVAPCTNFRELVYSDAAREQMTTRIDAYDRLHAGDRAAQQAVSSAPLPRMPSRKANELFTQAFVTLARGWMGDDLDTILGFWEDQLGVSVGAGEREAIVARLGAAVELAPVLRSVAEDHGLDVTDALRRGAACEAEPPAWPGQYLAIRVRGARRRNVTRKPRPSDWLDLDHAKHFPYVDVATCDADTLATVRSLLPKMSCPRQAVVVQNGHLDEVLVAVRGGA
jgi:hypothetical protein